MEVEQEKNPKNRIIFSMKRENIFVLGLEKSFYFNPTGPGFHKTKGFIHK